jgi:hypothetical protein
MAATETSTCRSLLLSLGLFVTSLARAQGTTPPPPPSPMVAASSFATTEVRFMGRYVYGKWMPGVTALEGPARFSITYGQPHARGRTILGNVVPLDSVWRLGANMPTELRTEVDITIGGTRIPHGVYTLWALPTKDGWQLIVNKEVGQYGTSIDYTPAADFVRIPLKARALTEPYESLSIYLIPNAAPRGTPAPLNPSGLLKIVWSTFELTAEWTLADWAKPKS